MYILCSLKKSLRYYTFFIQVGFDSAVKIDTTLECSIAFLTLEWILNFFRWNHFNESERSGMAVLDVTVPTGYIVQQQDLDAYVISRRVRNLQRAKFQERKVYFYFDFVRLKVLFGCIWVFFFFCFFFQLDSEDICVNFTVERWYPVANMSRYVSARVYDYYAPGERERDRICSGRTRCYIVCLFAERFNETLIDSLSTYVLDICQVCGSSQCPYCWIYNTANHQFVPILTILTFTLIQLLIVL